MQKITPDQWTIEDPKGGQPTLKNSEPCFEGDCIHHNIPQHNSRMSSKQRLAMKWKKFIWPSKEIPIEIPRNMFCKVSELNYALLSDTNGAFRIALSQENKISDSMERIQKRTCVKFRQRQPDDIHYITFTKRRTECRTGSIGVNPEGATVVNLETRYPGEYCFIGRTVTHELLHAIGLHHEHQRPDRDQYVTIIRENIALDESGIEENFGILGLPVYGTYGLPYDFMSIMHYQRKGCGNGNDTIVPRPPYAHYADLMGRRDQLEMSENDAIKVNRMLGCTDDEKTLGKRRGCFPFCF